MGRLFGTDGIRGMANEYPITPEMAVNIGRAVSCFFSRDRDIPEIIIGKDTRISGYMLEYALASGICSTGVNVCLAGIIPTPGLAFMTSSTDAGAGIVISASHNPFYDNGIKIFKEDGFKLSDNEEAEIEQIILDDKTVSIGKNIRETGSVYNIDDSIQRYSSFLKSTIKQSECCKGLKIVIDCSNGATYRIAPELFSDIGADVIPLFVQPDGKNINENCGSQHPEILSKYVVDKKADIGLAFDGDGDRLIAVDEKGKVLTGDQTLAVCAGFLKQKKMLKNNIVVSTVMSNIGLGIALKNMGMEHVVSDVGDRYVMEKMISCNASIGGEESGHTIFLDYQTTGDGILTALMLVESMKWASKPLSELGKIMTVFPQVLINVEVTGKPDVESIPKIKDAIRSVEASLGEKGRVLVRYSGTQPLCRIMVEGEDMEETGSYCRQLADIVQEKLVSEK